MPEQERQGPHPFLWLLAVALVLALVAAALAPDRAPAAALYWNPIYRAEIALVVLAVAYLLAVVGWMAWHGQAFRRIELPGGTALERDTVELDEAADDFDGFQASVSERLDAIEASLAVVIGRVDELGEGSQRGGARVP
jgi:hypothetical protein